MTKIQTTVRRSHKDTGESGVWHADRVIPTCDEGLFRIHPGSGSTRLGARLSTLWGQATDRRWFK